MMSNNKKHLNCSSELLNHWLLPATLCYADNHPFSTKKRGDQLRTHGAAAFSALAPAVATKAPHCDAVRAELGNLAGLWWQQGTPTTTCSKT